MTTDFLNGVSAVINKISRNLNSPRSPRIVSSENAVLTNYELGAEVHGKGVQLGLNFAGTAPELFAGQEMGEDALRVLNDYRKLYVRIIADVKSELPHVRAAVAWSKRV